MTHVSIEAGRSPIRIGCAGWSIPSVHAALFGEGDSMLARYATRFDTVEINSCFYRPHRPQTYERWAASVPPGFRFSVKLPRSITHEARLIDGEDLLARFLGEIAGLGDRLGGILVQLPPGLALDLRVADDFFARMRARIDVPIACEPRHRTWFAPDADALWMRYRIARVAADPARVPSAAHVAGHGDWNYWRWHGSPKIYYSAYDDAQLQSLAAELMGHSRPDRPAWCILDNTAAGHAIADATKIQTLCRVMAPGPFAPQRPASPLQHALRF